MFLSLPWMVDITSARSLLDNLSYCRLSIATNYTLVIREQYKGVLEERRGEVLQSHIAQPAWYLVLEIVWSCIHPGFCHWPVLEIPWYVKKCVTHCLTSDLLMCKRISMASWVSDQWWNPRLLMVVSGVVNAIKCQGWWVRFLVNPNWTPHAIVLVWSCWLASPPPTIVTCSHLTGTEAECLSVWLLSPHSPET